MYIPSSSPLALPSAPTGSLLLVLPAPLLASLSLPLALSFGRIITVGLHMPYAAAIETPSLPCPRPSLTVPSLSLHSLAFPTLPLASLALASLPWVSLPLAPLPLAPNGGCGACRGPGGFGDKVAARVLRPLTPPPFVPTYPLLARWALYRLRRCRWGPCCLRRPTFRYLPRPSLTLPLSHFR